MTYFEIYIKMFFYLNFSSLCTVYVDVITQTFPMWENNWIPYCIQRNTSFYYEEIPIKILEVYVAEDLSVEKTAETLEKRYKGLMSSFLTSNTRLSISHDPQDCSCFAAVHYTLVSSNYH